MKKVIKWGLIGFAGLIVLAIVFGGTGEESPSGGDSYVTEDQQGAQEKEEEPVKRSWHEVKKWPGTGMKTTEAFKIKGDQWRVIWTNKDTTGFGGSYLGINVKRPGGTLPLAMAANAQGDANDTSYIYESGEFVLEVNGANGNWTIEVQDYY